MCVIKVIMLSSLADLHSYIERSQLTQELGGSQYYCHKTWISHRTVRTNTHLKGALTNYLGYVALLQLSRAAFPKSIVSLSTSYTH